MLDLIRPDWPAPANVKAFTTTRRGGFSQGAWRSLNLGDRCGDNPAHVEKNRKLLRSELPAEPHWLKQVHGKRVVSCDEAQDLEPEADAVIGTKAGQVCAVLTADCLPVIFCNNTGTKIAAAHAGWRGLAEGVLEATVRAMQCDPKELIVWLGPAIGPKAFEVGYEVYQSFVEINAANKVAFEAYRDRWLADLYELSRLALSRLGVNQVYGGQYCTHSEQDKFFSYRRDGQSGRMATVIWF